MSIDNVEPCDRPSASDRKRWWLLCYAYTSMEKAIKCCQMIQIMCPNNSHPLFEPLILAIHAYYARPFKPNNVVGKLSKEMVPDGLVGIHDCLIHFRDGVFCHTDAGNSSAANRPMHDLVYSQHQSISEFSTSNPLPDIAAYSDFEAHCMAMAVIFRSKIIVFEKIYSHCLPTQEGDFLMTLHDSADLFIPHTLPTRGILHYP